MKNKKFMIVVVLCFAITTGANAQTATTTATTTATNGDTVERFVAWGAPEFVSVEDAAKIFGTRNDHAVIAIFDSTTQSLKKYWSGRSIDGFYPFVKGGYSWDLDFKNPESNVSGYTAALGVGYTGKWFDLSVSIGRSIIGNSFVPGEKYGAWNGLFTARLIPVRIGANEVWRIYLGPTIGFQERKVMSSSTYDTTMGGVNISMDDLYTGYNAGVTFGGTFGVEWRLLMSGLRIFVDFDYRTYTTSYMSYVQINGEIMQDISETVWRHNFGINAGVKWQIGKRTDNYRSVE